MCCLRLNNLLTNSDLDKAYNELKPNAKDIRNFVKNGGRYLGFCLGAFLAGTDPGLNLLPPGSQTDQEIARPKSQVRNESDTVIQVDWKFATGPKAGTVRRGTWLYFQDGPVIQIPKGSPNVTVLATYTSNGDIAASVSPYGKGWVGLVGPHPEATQDWCESTFVSAVVCALQSVVRCHISWPMSSSCPMNILLTCKIRRR